MARELDPGMKAPNFKLPRDGGQTTSLSDYAGRKLVLYFYLKADTPGCTKEAIEFSRLKGAFAKADADILGRIEILAHLAAHGHETHRMLEAYGVWREKTMYGRKFLGIVRTTVLIGPDQRILRVWPKVSVTGHADDVLAAAESL